MYNAQEPCDPRRNGVRRPRMNPGAQYPPHAVTSICLCHMHHKGRTLMFVVQPDKSGRRHLRRVRLVAGRREDSDPNTSPERGRMWLVIVCQAGYAWFDSCTLHSPIHVLRTWRFPGATSGTDPLSEYERRVPCDNWYRLFTTSRRRRVVVSPEKRLCYLGRTE